MYATMGLPNRPITDEAIGVVHYYPSAPLEHTMHPDQHTTLQLHLRHSINDARDMWQALQRLETHFKNNEAPYPLNDLDEVGSALRRITYRVDQIDNIINPPE